MPIATGATRVKLERRIPRPGPLECRPGAEGTIPHGRPHNRDLLGSPPYPPWSQPAMSQGNARHLRLESIDGVTVVSFVESKIVSEESIQEVGEQLYSLVDSEGHRQLLLNFGNVQYMSSAAL